MIWHAVGLAASVLTMFSFVPQIAKVIRTRSAKDVSLLTLLQLAAGVTLWIVYGIYLKNNIIIMANSVTLATMIILLYLYRKYA